MLWKYRELLETISNFDCKFQVPDLTDSEVINPVLRHDIDFSLTGLIELGALEIEFGHKAIYFFRLDSRNYNLLAGNTLEIIHSLVNQGHQIGLHIDSRSKFATNDSFRNPLLNGLTLRNVLEVDIEFFSWHRPLPADLGSNSDLQDLVSIYSERYWNKEYYLSDSAGSWDNGKVTKMRELLASGKYFQLLIHPEWWIGNSATDSFAKSISSQVRSNLLSLGLEIRSFEELDLYESTRRMF
jgi:hypothetical protein